MTDPTEALREELSRQQALHEPLNDVCEQQRATIAELREEVERLSKENDEMRAEFKRQRESMWGPDEDWQTLTESDGSNARQPTALLQCSPQSSREGSDVES